MNETIEAKISHFKKHISISLGQIAAHYHRTYGMPLDTFKEVIEKKCPTIGDQMALIAYYKKHMPHLLQA